MRFTNLFCLLLVLMCVAAGCKKQPTKSSEQTSGEAEKRQAESPGQIAVEGAKIPIMSIHQAARAGFIDIVRQHIASGTDVNIKHGARNDTPLHWAADKGQIEVAELLIANRAYVNAKDRYGQTPLYRAITGGYKDFVELLIAKGANLNVKDRRGRTPLRSAKDKGHKEIIELLQKNGAK